MAESTTSDSLLIDARELARLMAVSLATLHRMKSAGKIGPRPLALSRGCVRWRRESVVRWLAACEFEGRLLNRTTWQSISEENTNGRPSRPRWDLAAQRTVNIDREESEFVKPAHPSPKCMQRWYPTTQIRRLDHDH